MKKFGKDKIPLFLACISVLGGKTLAKDINNIGIQNPKTVVAVGGKTSKNSSKGFINWVKNHKWQLVSGTLTTATVITLSALGIKYLIGKNNKEPQKEKPKKEEPKIEDKKKEPKIEDKKEEPRIEDKKKEPKIEDKKKEPKKEEMKEVDAVSYILDEAKKRSEELINHLTSS